MDQKKKQYFVLFIRYDGPGVMSPSHSITCLLMIAEEEENQSIHSKV